jgi:hypothetical protein
VAIRPGLKHFPTDENADEARECARSFVESHSHFFENSEEASSCGFPIFPQDQNKCVRLSEARRQELLSQIGLTCSSRIISALTRLMCQQEISSRSNTGKGPLDKNPHNKVRNDYNDAKILFIDIMN